jgi:hypothetical protein
MENDIVCHEIVRIPSYRSNIFSTQIFQELLVQLLGGFFTSQSLDLLYLST